MNDYKEIKGDLLKMFKDRHFDAIAHGCNCEQLMSGGIARQIASQFPEAALADMATTYGCAMKLGQLSSADTRYGVIYNLYTQFHTGSDFRLSALHEALSNLNNEVPFLRRLFNKPKLGIPMIGCGIGGGDWEEVKHLLQTRLPNWRVIVVIYNPEN